MDSLSWTPASSMGLMTSKGAPFAFDLDPCLLQATIGSMGLDIAPEALMQEY